MTWYAKLVLFGCNFFDNEIIIFNFFMCKTISKMKSIITKTYKIDCAISNSINNINHCTYTYLRAGIYMYVHDIISKLEAILAFIHEILATHDDESADRINYHKELSLRKLIIYKNLVKRLIDSFNNIQLLFNGYFIDNLNTKNQ